MLRSTSRRKDRYSRSGHGGGVSTYSRNQQPQPQPQPSSTNKRLLHSSTTSIASSTHTWLCYREGIAVTDITCRCNGISSNSQDDITRDGKKKVNEWQAQTGQQTEWFILSRIAHDWKISRPSIHSSLFFLFFPFLSFPFSLLRDKPFMLETLFFSFPVYCTVYIHAF